MSILCEKFCLNKIYLYLLLRLTIHPTGILCIKLSSRNTPVFVLKPFVSVLFVVSLLLAPDEGRSTGNSRKAGVALLASSQVMLPPCYADQRTGGLRTCKLKTVTQL